MEFFDKLSETIVSAGKDVGQKAKDVSEIAKLKMDIQRGFRGKTVCGTRKSIL